MNELYNKMQELRQQLSDESIIDGIFNYFNSDEVKEFIEFLEEEVENVR